LDLGFDTIGNATLIAYDDGPVLATDPWLAGDAYFGSWRLTHAIPDEQLEEILAVDVEQWKAEIPPIREFFDEFGDRLPSEISAQLDALEERLNRA